MSQSDAAASHRLAFEAQQAQQSGDADKAIDLYRQSLDKYPDAPAAWNNLGLLLMGKARYTDALEAFERAAALSPSDPRPMLNAGVVCDRAGWHQKALDHFVLALGRDPRDLSSLRGAVALARKLGLADQASLDRVRTAIELDTSPEWRPIYEREQSRIESALRDR